MTLERMDDLEPRDPDLDTLIADTKAAEALFFKKTENPHEAALFAVLYALRQAGVPEPDEDRERLDELLAIIGELNEEV